MTDSGFTRNPRWEGQSELHWVNPPESAAQFDEPIIKPERRWLRRLLWWVGVAAFGLSAFAMTAPGVILITPAFMLGSRVFPNSFVQSIVYLFAYLVGMGCWTACFILWFRRRRRQMRVWDIITAIASGAIAAVVYVFSSMLAIITLSDVADVLTRNSVIVEPASPRGCRVVLDEHYVIMGPWIIEIFTQPASSPFPGQSRPWLTYETSTGRVDEEISPILAGDYGLTWQDSNPYIETATLRIGDEEFAISCQGDGVGG